MMMIIPPLFFCNCRDAWLNKRWRCLWSIYIYSPHFLITTRGAKNKHNQKHITKYTAKPRDGQRVCVVLLRASIVVIYCNFLSLLTLLYHFWCITRRAVFFHVFLFDDLGWMVHCAHFVFAKELQQGFWTWAKRHILWGALRDAVVWICWYASPLYGFSVWVWWMTSKTIGINKKINE